MPSLALQVEPRPRQILHVNTDDFFASLARLRDRTLAGRPVVVGHVLNRGSVVSASYEARAAGVHPGLTMQQAQRLAPDARLVQVDWAFARRVASELRRILDAYAPRVEPVGYDEAYLDYTGCERLHGHALDAGTRLRLLVRERLDLDVSIGLAANKLVSRFASSAAKRHSLVDVLPGYEARFLAPRPVSRLPGVTPALGRRLRDLGVPTVGDLGRIPEAVLAAVFGALGRRLAEAARGIDPTPVARAPARAACVESATFEPDALDRDAIAARIVALAGRLGMALRARGVRARELRLRLEHSDRVSVSRRVRLRPPAHVDAALADAACAALAQAYVRRVRVRRADLEAAGLEPSPVQLELFQPDTEARLRRLARAADQVRNRYPTAAALLPARALAVPAR